MIEQNHYIILDGKARKIDGVVRRPGVAFATRTAFNPATLKAYAPWLREAAPGERGPNVSAGPMGVGPAADDARKIQGFSDRILQQEALRRGFLELEALEDDLLVEALEAKGFSGQLYKGSAPGRIVPASPPLPDSSGLPPAGPPGEAPSSGEAGASGALEVKSPIPLNFSDFRGDKGHEQAVSDFRQISGYAGPLASWAGLENAYKAWRDGVIAAAVERGRPAGEI